MLKVKFHLIACPENIAGEKTRSSTLPLTSTLAGLVGQHHSPAALSAERPGARCVCGTQNLSRRVRKITTPLAGFETQTVQSVAR